MIHRFTAEGRLSEKNRKTKDSSALSYENGEGQPTRRSSLTFDVFAETLTLGRIGFTGDRCPEVRTPAHAHGHILWGRREGDRDGVGLAARQMDKGERNRASVLFESVDAMRFSFFPWNSWSGGSIETIWGTT